MGQKQPLKYNYGLDQIHVVPLINVIVLALFFFLLIAPFASQPSISVKIPKTIPSSNIQEDSIVITITGEDVIYLNDQIITLKKLQNDLQKNPNRKKTILVKADRRASLDRMITILDICRGLGIKNINIATNQEK